MVHPDKVRELAYQIWEAEGKPQGEATCHWKLASDLVETEIDGYIPPVTHVHPLEPIDQQEPFDQ